MCAGEVRGKARVKRVGERAHAVTYRSLDVCVRAMREKFGSERAGCCVLVKRRRVCGVRNRTIDRSVVVVEWCDAMRCEGSKMKCGRVGEGCFDFGKRADVMSE